MNLDPKKLSGLTGQQVLQLVLDTVEQEREACAKIADEMAEGRHGRISGEVCYAIAAQIRQRGKA